MPAQKLTKGRLIQILVSLTVLIIAFTWRTFHHDEIVSDTMKTASCSSYPCTIQTKDNEFALVKRGQELYITDSKDNAAQIVLAKTQVQTLELGNITLIIQVLSKQEFELSIDDKNDNKVRVSI